jgi:hypothetical protein
MNTFQVLNAIAVFLTVTSAATPNNVQAPNELKDTAHLYMKRQVETLNNGNCFDEVKTETKDISNDKEEDCVLTKEKDSESTSTTTTTKTTTTQGSDADKASEQSDGSKVQIDGKLVDPKWYYNGANSGVDNSNLIEVDGKKVNPKDYFNGSGRTSNS